MRSQSNLTVDHNPGMPAGRLLERLREINAITRDDERHAERSRVMALVAHEINNIATPLASYAQIALESTNDAALVKRALEAAVTAAQRLGEITSLLTFEPHA